ncbi:MAG: restriction endonuclease subunit M [Flavobacteriaceae bacterium]|nr:restriction endonuclease subunit M [Flavobacteriaceae bacterium]|tara:strand:+ start:277993 stop:281034 length:3042 start_codon:yes stop_codon:yes gene_type:complete
MSLFQNSVLNKYLKGLNNEKVNTAYTLFTEHFHNPEIQNNIRNSKEEQYQEGFLRDLFVKVFGYTLNPETDFNLTTELKNIKGSKKTDGAILKDGKALAVIELKGTNTTDLGKVENQAFGYKNNQPGCNYVITANFEKIRFYIDNAVDFEEFNLFQLSKQRFEILWLCLSSEYLLKDIPKKIKNESLTQEENVTKKLYKDYALFRNEIFDAIQKENLQYDKLTLFKKTQKLLDRFLFIFFAEDRLLLPPNSIRTIVNQWTDLKDKYDEYFPLYDRFKKYFGYMNTGYKGQQHDIFAYNGGLFAPDDILDNIYINDEILHKHTLQLSTYDFESEVSVNILGHIFEHSLNDIEEIQAELSGTVAEKTKTKRKKDGVFYTPKYITKYIVDNTVGKLCEEKKNELEIQEEEYEKERKGRQKATLKKLNQKLEDYRNWLLQITICDPACGSGAFLNQALDFLIHEHRYIDELQAKLFGDTLVMSEIENSILENNLFGVDINEESVEIAKLSLWLRTAQKGRKLTSLNNNIKCGNSLIDDPVVAGEKAFHWQNEFPEVFSKGGFDVVIGNPPYVDNRGFDKDVLQYLFNMFPNSFEKSGTDKFKTTKLNLIAPFIEINSKILKHNGYLSYIFHKNIFKTNGYTAIRKFILENFYIELLTDWGAGQFQDVVAETATFTLKKNKKLNENLKVEFYNLYIKKLENTQSQKVFLNSYDYIYGIYSSKEDRKVLKKIEKADLRLKEIVNINNGIVTGNDKKYLSNSKINSDYKKALRGKDINRYGRLKTKEYIYYKKDELLRARDEEIFKSSEKLIMQMINIDFVITYDEKQYYNLGTTYAITPKKEVNLLQVLGILNSKLIGYYYRKKYTNDSTLTNAISTRNLYTLPIIISNDDKFIKLVNDILEQNKALSDLTDNKLKLILSKYNFSKPSRKLQTWYKLDFGEFIKELEKVRKKSAKENETEYKKLSLSEEAEWMQYFKQQKEKVQDIKAEIDKTDKEIDAMVYQLYGLTEEEISIIESSL